MYSFCDVKLSCLLTNEHVYFLQQMYNFASIDKEALMTVEDNKY